MIVLAKLAAAWTAAWGFLALPPAAVADDDERRDGDDAVDHHETDLRVLMSHWF